MDRLREPMTTRRIPVRESPQDAFVIGLCTYELVALTTGLVPPLTQVGEEHPSLVVGLTAWWFAHFRRPLLQLVRGRR